MGGPGRPGDVKDDAAASVHDFATFWKGLDQQARSRGLLAGQWAARASELADRREQTDHKDHEPFSKGTVYDRVKHGRRVDWDEARWFVKALDGLDEAQWKAAWERAEEINKNGKLLQPEPDQSGLSGHEEIPRTKPPTRPDERVIPQPLWKRPRLLKGAALAVAMAAAAVIWLLVDDDAEVDAFGCANVTAEMADVYRNPDGTDSLTIKVRGERVTFPRAVKETVGLDGRPYRMVRTPKRTESSYAYMLSETLTMVSC